MRSALAGLRGGLLLFVAVSVGLLLAIAVRDRRRRHRGRGCVGAVPGRILPGRERCRSGRRAPLVNAFMLGFTQTPERFPAADPD